MDFLKFLEIFTSVSFDLPSFLFPKSFQISFLAILLFISLLLSPFLIHILHILSLCHSKFFFLGISLLLFSSSPWFFRHLPVFSLLFFSTPFFLFLIFLDLFCLQYLLVVMFHCSSISFLSFLTLSLSFFFISFFLGHFFHLHQFFPSLDVSTSLFLHLFSPSVFSIFSFFFIPL